MSRTSFKQALALALLTLGFLTATGQAALISLWSFDNSNLSTTSGGGTMTASGSYSFPAGTTLNDPRPSPTTTPGLLWNASGGSFSLTVSGTGLSDFIITYAAQKNGNNGNQTWAYSIDGGAYVDLAAALQPKASGSLGILTVDFSSITALNGAASITFRNTFASDIFYDNIQINASPVPEPVNIALAGFGMCVVGVGIGRRQLAKKSDAV